MWLSLIALLVLVYSFSRSSQSSDTHGTAQPIVPTAQDILNARYANGEINQLEYESITKELQSKIKNTQCRVRDRIVVVDLVEDHFIAGDEVRRMIMLAKSVMNTKVISILPTATIKETASTLYKHRISAVPVVDTQQRLLGIVSEGDLIYREEIGTEHRRSWWLSLLGDSERLPYEFIKSHTGTAKDIMTTPVISVTEETPVHEIADLLELHRIKRVPVLQDDKIVGIVSRANLVQNLAAEINESANTSEHNTDLSIRDTLVKTLHDELGIPITPMNIIVENGVVHVWGFVDSEHEQGAIQIAAESIDGVKNLDSRMILYSTLPTYGIRTDVLKNNNGLHTKQGR